MGGRTTSTLSRHHCCSILCGVVAWRWRPWRWTCSGRETASSSGSRGSAANCTTSTPKTCRPNELAAVRRRRRRVTKWMATQLAASENKKGSDKSSRRKEHHHHRRRSHSARNDQQADVTSLLPPTTAVLEFVETCKRRGVPEALIHEHALFMVDTIRSAMEHASERHRLQADLDASAYDTMLEQWTSTATHLSQHASTTLASSPFVAASVQRSPSRTPPHYSAPPHSLSRQQHQQRQHLHEESPLPPPTAPPPQALSAVRATPKVTASNNHQELASAFRRSSNTQSSPAAPMWPPPAAALSPIQHGPDDSLAVVSPPTDTKPAYHDTAVDAMTTTTADRSRPSRGAALTNFTGGTVNSLMWSRNSVDASSAAAESRASVACIVTCDAAVQFSPPGQRAPGSLSPTGRYSVSPRMRHGEEFELKTAYVPTGHAKATKASPEADKEVVHTGARRAENALRSATKCKRSAVEEAAMRCRSGDKAELRRRVQATILRQTEHLQCTTQDLSTSAIQAQLARRLQAADQHIQRQLAARKRVDEAKAAEQKRATVVGNFSLTRQRSASSSHPISSRSTSSGTGANSTVAVPPPVTDAGAAAARATKTAAVAKPATSRLLSPQPNQTTSQTSRLEARDRRYSRRSLAGQEPDGKAQAAACDAAAGFPTRDG
jgi:hypothetical protein